MFSFLKSFSISGVLRKIFPHKEIGWIEHGEIFYRYTLAKTPWFNLYLHELTAPNWPPHCHDHPWNFIALILWNGYDEMTPDGNITFRGAGSLLYRPARFAHNVRTRGTSWSIILTTKRFRTWRIDGCRTFQTEKGVRRQ